MKIEELTSHGYAERNCTRLVKRLRREKEMLFTLHKINEINCRNNNAKRQVRTSVVIRKITYGNRSDDDAYAHKVLMSMQQSCKLSGENFYDYMPGYLAESASKR